MVKQMLVILIVLSGRFCVQAQGCFALVQLDKSSVYVQQPFKVTITVLTATWFTAPVEFDNLQVPNAFVLPFSRNFPGMFDHNGKQYAGIQFHFIVFPYRAGHFTLPPIVVHATTPPEGSSESKAITIRTPVRHFTVKPVPADREGDWFVARSVTIHEHWNKSLSQLKVGDVIERTITVNARGTLPQFIPAIKPDNLNFANIYPQDPELKDLRDDYDANGQLTQQFIYLMEKEGNFEIPGIEVQWWNPNVRRLQKRALPAHRITVMSNPGLGMVTSIRDSLDATQQKAVAPPVKKPFTIWGMKWYVFVAYAVPALLVLNIFIRIIMRFVRREQSRYQRYRQSELFWFRRLMATSGSSIVFWKQLYAWWDRVSNDNKASGLVDAFGKSGDADNAAALTNANAEIYNQGLLASSWNVHVKRGLRPLRKWITAKAIGKEQGVAERQAGWK